MQAPAGASSPLITAASIAATIKSAISSNVGLSASANLTLGGPLNVSGGFSVNSGTVNVNGNATVTGGVNSIGGAGNINFNGAFNDSNTGTTFNAANGRNISVAGPYTTTGGLIKTGPGALFLSGNNAGLFSGVTDIRGGTLLVDSAGALGSSTAASDLVLNSGVRFVNTVAFNHNFTLTGGTVRLDTGTTNSALTGNPTLTASTTINLDADGIFGGAWSDTSANVLSVTKTSPFGTQYISQLTGTNTHSGATTLFLGEFRLLSPGALSTNSNAVIAGTTAGFAEFGLTAGSGNFTRGLGTGANQIQWTGTGGFVSYSAGRIVNLGGASAPLTWGSGGFVPIGEILQLGINNNLSTLDFQNPIALVGTDTVQTIGGANAVSYPWISGQLSGSGGLRVTGGYSLAVDDREDQAFDGEIGVKFTF